MAHAGPDDKRGDDTASTTGWSWGAGVAVGLCIGVVLGSRWTTPGRGA